MGTQPNQNSGEALENVATGREGSSSALRGSEARVRESRLGSLDQLECARFESFNL